MVHALLISSSILLSLSLAALLAAVSTTVLLQASPITYSLTWGVFGILFLSALALLLIWSRRHNVMAPVPYSGLHKRDQSFPEKPDESFELTLQPSQTQLIPRLVHFVFFQTTQGAYPFDMVKYITWVAAIKHVKPQKIFFHTNMVPDSWWYKKALDVASASHVEVVNVMYDLNHIYTVYGIKILQIQHVSDVVRLRAVYRYGGIYLDWDMVLFKSIDDLLYYPVVMAVEVGEGMCNACYMSEPHSTFLYRWLQQYKTFDPTCWACVSVQAPYKLAVDAYKAGEDLIRVLRYDQGFFFPLWWPTDQARGLAALFSDYRPDLLEKPYGMHLWDNAGVAKEYIKQFQKKKGGSCTKIYTLPMTTFTAIAQMYVDTQLAQQADAEE